MKIRSIVVAAAAVAATSVGFAGELATTAKLSQPASRAQTLLAELATGMRDVLRAVVPEIALPAIDVKLPALDSRMR